MAPWNGPKKTTTTGNLQEQKKRQLTENDEWNADEAEYSCARQSEHAGPSAPHQLPVHEEYAGDVGRDLDRSHDERVDVDVAMEIAGVQRQRVVEQTAREPGHDQPPKTRAERSQCR